MSELVDELVAHAKAAKRHKDAYDREMERVRALLPQVRLENPGLGPRRLEGMIGGVLERGTISRLTAEAVGTARKREG